MMQLELETVHLSLPFSLAAQGVDSASSRLDIQTQDDIDHDTSDDEHGTALEQNAPAKPQSVSQKKRADYAAFESWLETNQDEISQARKERQVDVEEKSASWLIRDFEAAKIIESPRDYQFELFERAKEKNIIAVLDTGSGKTLIAALLLRHIIDKELEDRSHGLPRRVSFFLVDKVALVHQQHAVLECNLDQPIEQFCGDDMRAPQSKSKAFWDKVVEDNMIIVCTAAILQDCLIRSYIRMDQINLLIFDEAHHTKKNHPYARIIKDFYAPEEATQNSRRPKIFGMTASPVDAQVDVKRAAEELEGLLHSEIATVADPSALQHTICKPKTEMQLYYSRQCYIGKTELTSSLEETLRPRGLQELFRKQFMYSEDALASLGPWCVDRFWQIIFRPEEVVKLEAKTERKFSGTPDLEFTINRVRDAAHLVECRGKSPLTTEMLADKVVQLQKSLSEFYSRRGGDKTRCIVFVEQRYTAMMLADLFQQPAMKVDNLRVSTLVGTEGTEDGNSSFRGRVLTIIKFKKGEVNCLFATSVAEEGLDIPDCNLVVRFDLPRTMIQYIQSRGRARHHDSAYIHMLESGNRDHLRTVYGNQQNEHKLRSFCQAVPEDRKLKGNNFDMEYFLKKEKKQRKLTVAGSLAVLTYQSSLVVLAEFVSSLPHGPEVTLTASYTVMRVGEGFVCEVLLPVASPIRSAIGMVHSRKQVAKCAAAFDMCRKLLEGNYINEYLKSSLAKQLPAMRNARLAISSKKKKEYGMKLKPRLWSILGTPTGLFATVLKLSSPENMYHASRPLVLLTRQPVPQVPPFPLFFGKGRASGVECIPISKPLEASKATLETLTSFTKRIFHDVFSKEFEGSAADFPYFIAPSEPGHRDMFRDDAEVQAILDWSALDYVHKTDKVPYDPNKEDEPDEFFREKFVIDPFDGSRKFILTGVRRDVHALDPLPDDIPVPRRNRDWLAGKMDHNILNWSVSLWSKARARRTFSTDQPVVEAELLSLRRNLLDDRVGDDELCPKKCLIVLETMLISSLPVDIAAMAYNFPAIIHRVESTLIALNACEALGLDGISPDLALEAITKDCDNSDEHGEAPVNFQAGMGRNYERLELLGDSFLKMATTISLYTLIPESDEFEYHVDRMLLICNKNLFNNALDVSLEEYVRSQEFNRHTWYPSSVPVSEINHEEEQKPGLVLKSGRKTMARSVHVLGDKSIADVCEAFIGAAYLSTLNESFDLAVRAVSAVVKNKNHNMTSYEQYYAAYEKPRWQLASASPTQLELAQQIKARMGYEFRYPRLLRTAFMHPSYPKIYEHLPNYQRLEFLGDALFDMVAVDYIFHRFPDKDPQWLTEHKMAMVSNQFLGALSVSLGFNRHVVSFSGALQRSVLTWVTEITDARNQAEEDAIRAGRTKDDFARDYWVHVTQPPKCLPDVLEAYIGAIFVDSEYDYGVVKDFFHTHVQPWFEDMHIYDTFANKHPVTFAANMLTHKFACRDWRAIVQETPAEDDGEGGSTPFGGTQVAAGFMVHGKVLGYGKADSGRYAKISAAKAALARLESLSLSEFRAETGCKCGAVEEEDEVEVVETHATAV